MADLVTRSLGLEDISDAVKLKLDHLPDYGLVCVTMPSTNGYSGFTINMSTEDFVTMLKWYCFQKGKDENYHAIQWSEEEQEFADSLVEKVREEKSVDNLLEYATRRARIINPNGKIAPLDYEREC